MEVGPDVFTSAPSSGLPEWGQRPLSYLLGWRVRA